MCRPSLAELARPAAGERGYSAALEQQLSAGKNHYYVPQFYFRRFSPDGKSVCGLVRSKGALFAGAPIKGQASKTLFYGDSEVEKALAQLEGICSAALRALDGVGNPEKLDEGTQWELLMHLALQHSRTQAARQASQPMQDRLMQLYLEVRLNNDTELDEETKAQFREMLPDVSADPVQSQRLAMGTAMKMSTAIWDLRPVLLVNKTNRPFIFGDAPVVFYNAACFDVKLRGVLGMAAFGLLVFMPLDSSKCLMLFDETVYAVRGAREGRLMLRELTDVAALNKLQLHAASDCVYFGDKKFGPYVQALWKEESKRLSSHEGKVVQAPGFDAQTGEPLGDIVHSFNAQVNYRLKLSFLQHESYSDRDERPLKRATFQEPEDDEDWLSAVAPT